MMSLNSADALRRKLEEEHDFNAEQANGTLMIVDEMVDSGIDRVLKRIADLESKMDTSIASLRSDMDARFKVVDDRFNVIEKHLKIIELVMPVASAFFTIALLAGLAAIIGGVMEFAP